MKIEITNIDGSILFEGAMTPGKEGIILGNDRTCDVYLPYLAIAQQHVRIQHASPAEAILTDLGGAGAVQVNGNHLQPGFVAHVSIGDKIQLAEGLFLSLRPSLEPEIPAIGQEEGGPTIFPFFIDRNERLVKEIFTELRTQLPTSARTIIKGAEDRVTTKIRELSAVLEVSFALNSIFNYQRLLEYVLDMAQKVTGTKRGAILLFNEEIDRLETVFLRGGSLKELEKDLKATASDVLKCFRTGELVFFPPVNPAQESMRSKRAAVADQTANRAVALAPLRNQSGVIGVLYLDRPYSAGVFTPQSHDLLRGFAAQASVAIQNARHLHMATTDPLTGLSNQKHFHQRLMEEFYRSVRHGQPLSVMMLHLDHFEDIIAKLGSVSSDQMLKKLGRQIAAGMRIHDLAARYNSESFAIILPATPGPGAVVVAEKLQEKVSQTVYRIGKKPSKLTATIGISCVQKKMEKPMDLLRAADEALKKAIAEKKPVGAMI